MRKKLLLFATLFATGQFIYAQALSSKTGLKFYEHHSTAIAGSTGANGSQSAYDFVKHSYVNSFDPATFTSYTDGTDTTIDMVEHNGQFGGGGQFGFTSGMSTIWPGEIKGNGKTLWMEAPATFNYATVTNVNDLKTVFNSTVATTAIATVGNKVYIGRIRNSDLYVAMRCYNVTNKSAGNTYFDFEYKYGTWSNQTSTNDINVSKPFTIYPNPATENIIIRNINEQKISVKLISLNGQEVYSTEVNFNSTKTIDLHSMSNGMYMIVGITESGKTYFEKFIKQ